MTAVSIKRANEPAGSESSAAADTGRGVGVGAGGAVNGCPGPGRSDGGWPPGALNVGGGKKPGTLSGAGGAAMGASAGSPIGLPASGPDVGGAATGVTAWRVAVAGNVGDTVGVEPGNGDWKMGRASASTGNNEISTAANPIRTIRASDRRTGSTDMRRL